MGAEILCQSSKVQSLRRNFVKENQIISELLLFNILVQPLKMIFFFPEENAFWVIFLFPV